MAFSITFGPTYGTFEEAKHSVTSLPYDRVLEIANQCFDNFSSPEGWADHLDDFIFNNLAVTKIFSILNSQLPEDQKKAVDIKQVLYALHQKLKKEKSTANIAAKLHVYITGDKMPLAKKLEGMIVEAAQIRKLLASSPTP